jgi:hypothetical protein
MWAILLTSFGALLTLGAASAHPKITCSTEPSLGIAHTGPPQSLQYTTNLCIEDVCTTGIKAREKNTSFTEQCGLHAFTVTYVNPTLLSDIKDCIRDFNTIVQQCITVEHVQGGAVFSDNVLYTVSTLDNKEESALAVQRSTALNARQLRTQPESSAPPAARSTQLAIELKKPTTIPAKSTTLPAASTASAAKSIKLATQSPKSATKSPKQSTISTAIIAKPSKSPSKCKTTKGELGTCKAKRFVVKRTSTLAEIYKKIPATHRITTGNTKLFDIDNTKEAAFGATECIGCSVVVALNGKQLVMGHYAEEAGVPPTVTIEQKALTQKRIIDKMEEATDQLDEVNGHAWLIHSSRQRTPAGAVLWKQYMQDSTCIPENRVHIMQYSPIRVIEGGLEELPNGKIVVTVTPQANGEAIVALYNNSDTAIWSQRYDSCGDPC